MKKLKYLILLASLLVAFAGCSTDSGSSGGGSDPLEIPTTDLHLNEGRLGFVSSTTTNYSDNKSFPGYENKFIENLGEGSNIKFCVNANKEGNVKLSIKYAFWGTTTEIRAAYIFINGTLVNEDNPIFCPWTSKSGNNIWQETASIEVTLPQGNSFIEIQPVPTGTKLPDFDEYPSSVSPEDIPVSSARESSGKLPNFDYLHLVSKDPTLLINATESELKYWNFKISSNNDKYGTVTVTPEGASFENNTEITITATPAPGYKLSEISGIVGDTTWVGSKETTYKFNIIADTKLQARFVPENTTIPEGLVGYGTICDDNGTPYIITGGQGGEVIVIDSLDDLTTNKDNIDKIKNDDPYIIKIVGTITTVDNASVKIDVGSNKSIYGDVTDQGRLKNVAFSINGENIIIRNMRFGDVIADDYWRGKANDGLGLNGAKHVWIDHCEFASSLEPLNNDGTKLKYDSSKTSISPEEDDDPEEAWKKDFYDGALDIKNGAAFITISNCYFHDTWKACLCGSSDTQENGDSKMRLTFYKNYWNGINSRQPMIRYGKAHIFSSYFYGNGDSTGINCRCKAEAYIDNNYFENIKTPIGSYNGDAKYQTGKWVNEDNKFSGCDNSVASSSTKYQPPYEWTAISAEEAKATLPDSVGIGKLTAEDLQ